MADHMTQAFAKQRAEDLLRHSQTPSFVTREAVKQAKKAAKSAQNLPPDATFKPKISKKEIPDFYRMQSDIEESLRRKKLENSVTIPMEPHLSKTRPRRYSVSESVEYEFKPQINKEPPVLKPKDTGPIRQTKASALRNSVVAWTLEERQREIEREKQEELMRDAILKMAQKRAADRRKQRHEMDEVESVESEEEWKLSRQEAERREAEERERREREERIKENEKRAIELARKKRMERLSTNFEETSFRSSTLLKEYNQQMDGVRQNLQSLQSPDSDAVERAKQKAEASVEHALKQHNLGTFSFDDDDDEETSQFDSRVGKTRFSLDGIETDILKKKREAEMRYRSILESTGSLDLVGENYEDEEDI